MYATRNIARSSSPSLGISAMRRLWGHTYSSSSVKVERIDSGVVIRMGSGEKRVTPNFVRDMNIALDTAERYEDAKYMVTIGEGKYHSLGLDLDLYAAMSLQDMCSAIHGFHKLLARILTFPLVTVSAINGHAYAAGMFLPLAHDHRVMRTERGWLCLPETNIRAVFSAGLMEFLKACLPQPEHHKAIVLGKRYTAEEAKAVGIVHELSPLSQLESSAIEAGNRLAGEEGLDRKTLVANKHILYRGCYAALMEPINIPIRDACPTDGSN